MYLYPLINKPTHIKHGCHAIIDNIFTNVLNKDLSCGVIIDDTSDHFPIFLGDISKFSQKYLTERMMMKLSRTSIMCWI